MIRTATSRSLFACALLGLGHAAPSFVTEVEFGAVPPLDVATLMTAPLVDIDEEDTIWVRNRRSRASFDGAAFTVHPVFGPSAEREWPVRFDLSSVTRGNTAIDIEPVRSPLHGDGRVTVRRRGLTDVYRLGLDEIEQTWVFDELPGEGDLVLTLDVETDLEVQDAESVTFVHPTLGGVRYGEAFAIDADGDSIPIERSYEGGSIRIVVPADFLSHATLPLVVDPPVSAFTSAPAGSRSNSPDITYCGVSERYFVCWQEVTSTTNSDVYLTTFDRAGNGGGVSAVDVTNESWRTPRIAYSAGTGNLLVVAAVRGGFIPMGAILGRLFDGVTTDPLGSSFPISEVGLDSFIDPDVGGANTVSAGGGQFLVVWSETAPSNGLALKYRIYQGGGTPITDTLTLTQSPFEHAIQPAVSESHGNSALLGRLWTVAWIRDIDEDGFGQVRARRVSTLGSLTIGGGELLVEPLHECRHPSVTSRFDEPLFGDRPSIVAYERRPNVAGFMDSGIYARVIAEDRVYSANAISNIRQDLANPQRDQEAPSIASDGRGFLLTYVEAAADRETYVVSGNITVGDDDASIALAERGTAMTSGSGDDVQCRVATIRDGDPSSILDDGACVWIERTNGNEAGRIRGSTLDIGTAVDPAVGLQYCDAIPNATGRSSWMWIRGDQSRQTTHEAFCVDVPPDTFGYMLCSNTAGVVNMPGGSVGRLCVTGSVGRFVGQIGSSGSAGVLSATFDPLALPQPTGTAAAAIGERWFFQFWHRDVWFTSATSNFSNGCAVYFLP